ncbi:MAG: homogentisate 1,2-dioxygenase [Saprospiraceae bacterium]
MKSFYLCVCALFSLSAFSQNIESKSYLGRSEGKLLNGDGSPVKNLFLDLIKLSPHKKSKKIPVNMGEYLIIAKTGNSNIQTKHLNVSLSPGSIAIITKGDKFRLENRSEKDNFYYLMHCEAKDQNAGSVTAHSFCKVLGKYSVLCA